MSARLAPGVAVSALLRRANDAGGFGVVRARGDPDAGGVVVLVDGGARALERGIGPDGRPAIVEARVGDDLEDWWRRRRSRDPDLWVIELDVAQAERLVADHLLGN